MAASRREPGMNCLNSGVWAGDVVRSGQPTGLGTLARPFWEYNGRSISVLRRFLYVVNDKYLDRAPLGFKFQPKVLQRLVQPVVHLLERVTLLVALANRRTLVEQPK